MALAKARLAITRSGSAQNKQDAMACSTFGWTLAASIQDDPADWERESAKMAEICEDAMLTLAATHARSGTNSMFRNFKNVTF
jgi:hypothetical protein